MMNDWFTRYEEAVQQNKIDDDVIKVQAATIERFRAFAGLWHTQFEGLPLYRHEESALEAKLLELYRTLDMGAAE